jgi:polyferredoxin
MTLPATTRGLKPTSWKGPRIVWARRVTQVVTLGLFLYLLLKTEIPTDGIDPGAPIRVPYPTSIFLELDPLVGLSTAIATGAVYDKLLWSLVLIVGTLLIGRAFCGWICPVGTLNHFISWLNPFHRGAARVAANQYRPVMRFKFYLVIGLLAASVFTTNQIGLLDPICIAVRSIGLSVMPAANYASRTAVDQLYRANVPALHSTADALHEARATVLPSTGFHYHHAWLIGALFLALLLANRWITRFWCRMICPLGALLGFFSRFAWVGMEKKHENCTDCDLCMLHCQGGDMPIGRVEWRSAECHMCFNCEAACPDDVINFTLFPGRAAIRPEADLTRRKVLGSLVGGAVVIPLTRSSDLLGGGAGVNYDPKLIRPPGSVDEKAFLERCIKCGECMKVCPNNALHPTFMEAGIEGIWSPILIPRIGYCEESCVLCGQVCPTGAIQHITEDDKRGTNDHELLKIGTAFYDRGRCLPWAMATPCIVCEEWCPTSPKAIWAEDAEVPGPNDTIVKVQLPHVDPTRCIGCGACEKVCPVVDQPAVYVTNVGETRSTENVLLLKTSPTGK